MQPESTVDCSKDMNQATASFGPKIEGCNGFMIKHDNLNLMDSGISENWGLLSS